MVALHENVCLALSLSAVDASAFADKLAPTLKAIATDGTTIVNRTSMASTISYMNGNPAPRVIIADHGIFFKTNLDLALKLSEFVRDGGHLVVLAGTSEHLKRELDAVSDMVASRTPACTDPEPMISSSRRDSVSPGDTVLTTALRSSSTQNSRSLETPNCLPRSLTRL